VLSNLWKSAKIVPAEITYWDIPAAPTIGKGQGIAGQFLNHIQRADALLLVVRAFNDPSVPHLLGSVDQHRDIETMQEELAFADLDLLERNIQRREASVKSAKPQEREAAQRELALLRRLKEGLENGAPVREQQIAEEERKLLAGYQLLTGKPLLILSNMDEGDAARRDEIVTTLRAHYRKPGMTAEAMCGKLEAELVQLSPEDQAAFRESLGVTGESGSDLVIRASYALLGLISYFTGGAVDAHAWTVARDTPAVKAAGRIHSDLERGFIRAEVVSYPDLVRCGSLAEARRQGVLRVEGKTYPVQDGDVITFLVST
jgi:GTP-binding protein YchF